MAIDPSGADLQRFGEGDAGEAFVMVQLLRFAEGGRERYLQYSAKAHPFLTRVGAQVLYGGECNDPLLAPEGNWDAVVLVRYPSRGAYLEMVGDPEYQEIAPLRRSALREAALLPMNDWPGR
ncbi:MAG: DUF1330 domain-containing protein [Deltaproteobacteria bacterium]|nr:MAG: DUF1330 domain-containing protein [Deltaproteobacteria bacterium]